MREPGCVERLKGLTPIAKNLENFWPGFTPNFALLMKVCSQANLFRRGETVNEQTIFDAAVEILDPAERQAYVLKVCAGNETLHRQVVSLLTAHEQSGEFLDVPALEQIGVGAVGRDTNVDGAKIMAEPSFNPFPARGEERKISSPNDTQAESADDENEEAVLDFLELSTKPGVLGRLGHYEVLEVLGQGGFGTVVKAFDEKLHRMVAIKIMSPQLAATSPARKRFIREARSSAAIRHENVVDIHAIEEKPIPFLVMEYVAGETLQQRLDRAGPAEPPDVLRIGVQIAHGLAAAHAMGKIHRDIKPANILLENGVDRVKITDFGLARAADDASLTQSGVIAGTPMFMAPEQAQGVAIDHRADLFSFGSVLYVMCSGRLPFRASTTLAVLKRVAEDTPRPIREIIPEVPQWLCDVITKLHAKRPEDRFQSAKEVADLLGKYLTELQLHGKVQSVVQVLPKTASRPAIELDCDATVTCDFTPRLGANSPSATTTRRRRRLAVTAVVVLAMLLAGLSFTEATGVTQLSGTVIRLFSPDGTLVVEVDDPDVTVTIEGEEIVIKGTGAKEIRVKPGQYKVLATKDGKVVRQTLVTVEKNGRQAVRISRELDPIAKIDPKVIPKIEPKTTPPDADFSLEFDGKESYVDVPTLSRDEDHPITIEAYVTVAGTKGANLIRIEGNCPCQMHGWPGAQASTEWVPNGMDHQGLKLRQGTPPLTLGRRAHVAVQIDDQSLHLFMDGKKVNSIARTPGPANGTLRGTLIGAGKDRNRNTMNVLFAGILDEIRISKVIRYKEDFTPKARLETDNDTLALYHCDEGTGDVLKDSSGNEHHGKIVAAKWVQTPTSFDDPDRRTAEWALTSGGYARVHAFVGGEEIKVSTLDDLPKAPFELRILNVNRNPKVSDETLTVLKGLKHLTHLQISNSRATDMALTYFKDCKKLTQLQLHSTAVTDAGMEHLAVFSELQYLNLKQTTVSEEAVRKLAVALPKCRIEWRGPTVEPTVKTP
jgi:serine/threonine protein kinase